ncbi:hypothetical protein [Hafnia paralvei]|mgnify:CR=1 FL=1|jgi:hypothetical protein|uniref:hypothetical protein n=1 Tax=Hafnia paralvei TaxID=546367 RepID=UPI001CF13623|nr:hypothetical protein [Hafnia paralvei]EHM1964812.1 hypothetical protein [Escherichia coli]
MNNLPIQTYESVVQQRDALAAENANLKEVLGEIPKSLFKHVNGDTYEWQIRTKSPEEMIKEALSETPATDAFTRELMARGAEAFAKDWKAGASYSQISEMANKFADQLRKGINDAQ